MRKPESKQPPAPQVIWVPGEWPARALVINWDGGAIVTDCVTGRRVHVRSRIQITHVAGSGQKWRPVPALRGEVIERAGEVARVKFRDGQVVRVRLAREKQKGVA